MGYGYTWEKLHEAVQTLVGDGPLRDRLQRAVATAQVLERHSEGFPNTQLRERWRKLVDSINAEPDPYAKPDPFAALGLAEQEELPAAASEIVALFVEVVKMDVEEELRRYRQVL
jgi:hypothetical protein